MDWGESALPFLVRPVTIDRSPKHVVQESGVDRIDWGGIEQKQHEICLS